MRLLRAVAVIFAIASTAAVGHALYFGLPFVFVGFAPLAGIVSGLSVRRVLDSGIAAVVGVILGAQVSSVIANRPWVGSESWLLGAATAGLIAAGVGMLVAFSVRRNRRVAPLMTALAVLIVLGALWSTGFQNAASMRPGGLTLTRELASSPVLARFSPDGELYVAYLRGLEQGRAYYPTVLSVLQESNRTRGVVINIGTPLSYRLPTLYVALSRISRNGLALVVAALCLSTIATLTAFLLARGHVPVAGAVFGATAVAAFYLGAVGGLTLLDTELWSGTLGLVFATAFVASRRCVPPRTALVATALAAAIGAALVRELGIAFLIVGLLACLVEPGPGRGRRAAPWGIGLLATLGVYVAHWRAALGVIAASGVISTASASSWLRPTGSSLASAVDTAGRFMFINPIVPFSLLVFGLVGSFVGPRNVGARFALACTAIGGALALVFLGPMGLPVNGLIPSTWGEMVLPTVLACSPLVLAPFVREPLRTKLEGVFFERAHDE